MARLDRTKQSPLNRKGVYSYNKTKNPPSIQPDVTEFLIEVLDPQTGSITETLSLSGTHIPHAPFSRNIQQEAIKYYYPGGQANRVPTIQVLGSMEDDVVLAGRLFSTRIPDIQRRREPMLISSILERLTKEGNACRFTIGEWIRYGIITEFQPRYYHDANVEYQMRLLISGNINPITGEEEEAENAVARVFDTSEAQDFSQVAQEITNELLAEKSALEASGYVPKINVVPFSISDYLSRLVEGTAVGDVVDFGRSVFQNWIEIIRTIDLVTSSAVAFSEEVERTAEDIQRQILLITSQISKLYKIQENLFVAVSKVDSGLDTFTRLLTWNTLGDMVAYTHRLQGQFSDLKKATEREEIRNFKEIYFSKPDETLQSISTKFFGTPSRWQELSEINGLSLGEDLKPDTLLVIPN